MSAFDKFMIAEKLKEIGWTETESGFVPPEMLWENKPEYFSIYEADELNDLLTREEKSREKE